MYEHVGTHRAINAVLCRRVNCDGTRGGRQLNCAVPFHMYQRKISKDTHVSIELYIVVLKRTVIDKERRSAFPITSNWCIW